MKSTSPTCLIRWPNKHLLSACCVYSAWGTLVYKKGKNNCPWGLYIQLGWETEVSLFEKGDEQKLEVKEANQANFFFLPPGIKFFWIFLEFLHGYSKKFEYIFFFNMKCNMLYCILLFNLIYLRAFCQITFFTWKFPYLFLYYWLEFIFCMNIW